MRVQIVDPSAYTPAYDHALCAALARAGAEVELLTSRFAYGDVPAANGYAVIELFYRHARGSAGSRLRLATKLLEHVPDMLTLRRAAVEAEVVHFQWFAVQPIDRWLLPRRPTVLTAHDLLPREPRPFQAHAQQRLYRAVDAVVTHSEFGRRSLVERLGIDAAKVRVIHHGAFDHLTRQPAAELPRELGEPASPPETGDPADPPARRDPAPPPATGDPAPPPARPPEADPVGPPETHPAGPPGKAIVMFFGLLRPYKGLGVLLDAWRKLERSHERTELWVVGRPRMAIDRLVASAPESVRWVTRYVSESELAACFRRADVLVLPYLRTERLDFSGVLATALAFAKPAVVSDVGGFGEVADTGAALLVPPGDPDALAATLGELVSDRERREQLAARARAAADGPYSWQTAAEQTLALYRELAEG